MSTGSKLLTLGAVAGGGWLAYEMGWFSSLGFAPAGTAALPASPAAPAAPAPPAAAGSPPSAPPAPPAKTYPPLAQIYQQMVQVATAAAGTSAGACGDQPQLGMIPVAGGGMIPNPLDLVKLTQWQECQAKGIPMFTMDDWDAFAVQAGAPNPMPDPVPLFPGIDRSTKLNSLQYWAGVLPALTKMGLSGYMRTNSPLPGLGMNCPGDPGCPGYVAPGSSDYQTSLLQEILANQVNFPDAVGVPVASASGSASLTQWLNQNATTVMIAGAGLFAVLLLTGGRRGR